MTSKKTLSKQQKKKRAMIKKRVKKYGHSPYRPLKDIPVNALSDIIHLLEDTVDFFGVIRGEKLPQRTFMVTTKEVGGLIFPLRPHKYFVQVRANQLLAPIKKTMGPIILSPKIRSSYGQQE